MTDLDSDDGVLLVEQVPDDVVIVAETALQHHPPALVSPRIPSKLTTLKKVLASQ
jgi:hypothetical protein